MKIRSRSKCEDEWNIRLSTYANTTSSNIRLPTTNFVIRQRYTSIYFAIRWRHSTEAILPTTIHFEFRWRHQHTLSNTNESCRNNSDIVNMEINSRRMSTTQRQPNSNEKIQASWSNVLMGQQWLYELRVDDIMYEWLTELRWMIGLLIRV